jgi:hypothetical protein
MGKKSRLNVLHRSEQLTDVVDNNAHVLTALMHRTKKMQRVIFYLVLWALLATLHAVVNSPLAQYVALLGGGL